MIYPVRINKYLAEQKIASRREADELIEQGRVKINGRKAVLGEMVNESDKISVEGKMKKHIYLAFNKPEGVVTHSPQEGETGIADILKFNAEVFPIGRLDKESRGLILLSNDGRATDAVLNPAKSHEKEYEVRLDQPIKNNFLEQMEKGVRLDDGYITKKCAVQKLGDSSFSIVLTEGKKRQIRRMCKALGYKVVDLNRVRIMSVKLQKLKPGSFRIISGKERDEFLAELGL